MVTERANGAISSESRQDPFTSVIVDVLLRDKTIYSALHDELDRSDIDEGGRGDGSDPTSIKVRRTYNSIRSPPPILQVHCKRVGFDKKTGNAVRSDRSLRLDDVVYLDRFLENPASISAQELLERRSQFWQWQQKVALLQSRLDELSNSEINIQPGETIDLASVTEETARFLSELQESQMAENEPISGVDVGAVINGLPDALAHQAQALRSEKQSIETALSELQAQMDAQFEDLKGNPYRLHSIFIHRGGVSGGHYFVYIRDFKTGTWRIYNDETVSSAEEDRLAKAMGLVQSNESSTNVVYVRDDLKDRLTEAVCRHIVEPVDERMDVEMGEPEVLNGVEPQSQ